MACGEEMKKKSEMMMMMMKSIKEEGKFVVIKCVNTEERAQ